MQKSIRILQGHRNLQAQRKEKAEKIAADLLTISGDIQEKLKISDEARKGSLHNTYVGLRQTLSDLSLNGVWKISY